MHPYNFLAYPTLPYIIPYPHIRIPTYAHTRLYPPNPSSYISLSGSADQCIGLSAYPSFYGSLTRHII